MAVEPRIYTSHPTIRHSGNPPRQFSRPEADDTVEYNSSNEFSLSLTDSHVLSGTPPKPPSQASYHIWQTLWHGGPTRAQCHRPNETLNLINARTQPMTMLCPSLNSTHTKQSDQAQVVTASQCIDFGSDADTTGPGIDAIYTDAETA